MVNTDPERLYKYLPLADILEAGLWNIPPRPMEDFLFSTLTEDVTMASCEGAYPAMAVGK